MIDKQLWSVDVRLCSLAQSSGQMSSNESQYVQCFCLITVCICQNGFVCRWMDVLREDWEDEDECAVMGYEIL